MPKGKECNMTLLSNVQIKTEPNPYDKTRGPSNPLTEDGQHRAEFVMVEFNKLLKNHPEVKEAYEAGDVILKNFRKSSPNSHRNKFELDVRHSRIRYWYDIGFLVKPEDQRGTATEVKLSHKQSEYWVTQQFDKMLDKIVNPYVFGVSDHWENVWITNGAHRIVLDVRFFNPNDTGGIHRMNFKYELKIFDKLTGEVLKIQLKGIKSYHELVKKIGSANFKELANGFHPVDLYDYQHPTEEDARIDHAIVFGHSNVNLKQIQIIHSYFSSINKKIRNLSSWVGMQNKTLHKQIKRIWGNGLQFIPKNKQKNIPKSNIGTSGVFDKPNPKHFIEDRTYEFMLQSLYLFKNGLAESTMNKLDSFCKRADLDNKIWNAYITHLTYTVDVFIECRKLSAMRWHPTQKMTMVHLFAVLMLVRNTMEQIANAIVSKEKLALALDETIRELLEESEALGNGPSTWYGARKSFKSILYLKPFLNMIIVKLLEKKAIVLLDPVDNIDSKDKSLASNKSWLTGQTMIGKTEHHHVYVQRSRGGNSTPIDSEFGNVVPIEKEHNRKMNELKMETDEYVEYLLNQSPEVFTNEKRKYWMNGGMDDLESKVNNEKYLYQNHPDTKKKFIQDLSRIRVVVSEDGAKKEEFWDMIIQYSFGK
jgi:hypothetical protein